MKQSSSQLVSFFLDDEMYGLDIRIINEVYPVKTLTPVPRTDIQVQGLLNIRGQVVLVLDIFAGFHRQPRPIMATSQVVILKSAYELRKIFSEKSEAELSVFGDKPVGVLVDRVGDVIDMTNLKLEPVPTHLSQANSRLIEGVLQIGDELLVVLDAAAILVPVQ